MLKGKDADLLALLAQAPTLSEEDRDNVLSQLKGETLKIGRAIVGLDKNPSKKVQEAANEFIKWAKQQTSK